MVEGDPATTGHIIQTAPANPSSRPVISYKTEKVVGNGSFGVVYQASCLETGETVSGIWTQCWQSAGCMSLICERAVDAAACCVDQPWQCAGEQVILSLRC